jgi:hypothetical protein
MRNILILSAAILPLSAATILLVIHRLSRLDEEVRQAKSDMQPVITFIEDFRREQGEYPEKRAVASLASNHSSHSIVYYPGRKQFGLIVSIRVFPFRENVAYFSDEGVWVLTDS